MNATDTPTPAQEPAQETAQPRGIQIDAVAGVLQEGEAFYKGVALKRADELRNAVKMGDALVAEVKRLKQVEGELAGELALLKSEVARLQALSLEPPPSE